MNGRAERLQPGDELEQRRTARWAALMGLAGMLGFGTLLAGLVVVVHRGSQQTTEVARWVVRVEDRVERLEGEHAGFVREVAAGRKELEAVTAQEVARLRTRVGELAAGVSALREQADRAGMRDAQAGRDAVVGDLRDKLAALEARVARLSQPEVATAPRATGPVAEVARPAGFSSDEVERELRDMREVINRYREESRMAPAVRLPGQAR